MYPTEPLESRMARVRLRFSLETLRAEPDSPIAAQYWEMVFDALEALDREYGETDARCIGDGFDEDFEITDDDWADYHGITAKCDELDRQADARACGMIA